MSHATSRSGSEVSARSSLKGWGSGPTPNSANTPVSHDDEATRATNSPYGVSMSAIDPKALRPNSSPVLGPRMEGSDASKPMEQQIKQERIWWSEQTLFEVQKMELALKQELHKTTAGLREQFRRQLEVERNEVQQRTSTLDRSLNQLREDFDKFRQQDSSGHLREISESTARVEESLRLELNGIRCNLEDYKRQQAEDLSVRLAKDENDKARMAEEVKSTKEQLATLEAKTAESGERAMKHIEALRQDVKRLEEIIEEEQSAKRDNSAGELKSKIQDVSALLDRECQTRQAEVAAMRQEWRSEIAVTTKDIANELLKRRTEMDALKENLQAMESKATQNGGANIKDLTELLEIECKGRQTDVEELRRQLQLNEALLSNGTSREVQQTLDDIDVRLGRLVSAIDLERDHRRSDSERHHAALSDVMDSVKAERTLRANEVEKLRSALALLASNIQSASGSMEVSSRWSEAFASLKSTLETDFSKVEEGEQEPAEASVGGHTVTQLGREVAELANQLHQIHQQVLAQDSASMQVTAKLRGELTAKSAELRGDVAALRTEIMQKVEDANASPGGEALGAGGFGLQSNAALAGQMHEVIRLIQVIAQGTEHLGEKLCEEVSDRRQGDVALAQRLSSVERFVGEVPAAPEVFVDPGSPLCLNHGAMTFNLPPTDHTPGSGALLPVGGGLLVPEAAKPSLVSDSLKDSLEQLVTRVNRMLKPDKRTPRQGRSLNTSTAASRDNSMQQGDFAGGPRSRSQALDRQVSNSLQPNPPKASPKPEARSFGTPQPGGPMPARASFVAGGSPGPTSMVAPSQPRHVNPQPKQLQRVPGSVQGYHTMPPNAGFPVFRMPTQQQVVAKAGR